MLKGQTGEGETLDEKIKRIRKKNEEIEKRRLEVEADKQTAAKLNALVQLNASTEDWPLPRSHSPDEERGRKTFQEKPKERTRGNVTFGDIDESNRPPPDPAYRFLADSERDPLPSRNLERPQRHPRGRGHGIMRGRSRDFKGRPDMPPSNHGSPGYEAWRAERNLIDEERIRRQRTAQGQWRREWDIPKSEDNWETPRSEKTRDLNSASKRPPRSNIPPESTKEVIIKRRTFSEESIGDVSTSSKKNLGNSGPTAALESRNVQNRGNCLHVSFVNEPSVVKGTQVSSDTPVPSTNSRRPVVGSGRVGLPPPKPPSKTGPEAGPAPGVLPQRRPREPRPRRRSGATFAGGGWGRKGQNAPRGRKSSGDGDDSWEDADDHSDEHGDADVDVQRALAATTTTTVTATEPAATVAMQQLPVASITYPPVSADADDVRETGSREPLLVGTKLPTASGGNHEEADGKEDGNTEKVDIELTLTEQDETLSSELLRVIEVPIDTCSQEKVDQTCSASITEPESHKSEIGSGNNDMTSAELCIVPEGQKGGIASGNNDMTSAEPCIVEQHGLEIVAECGTVPPESSAHDDAKPHQLSISQSERKDVFEEATNPEFEKVVSLKETIDSAMESIRNQPMTDVTNSLTMKNISESPSHTKLDDPIEATIALLDGMSKSAGISCSSDSNTGDISVANDVSYVKVEDIPENTDAGNNAIHPPVPVLHNALIPCADEKVEESAMAEMSVVTVDGSQYSASGVNSQTTIEMRDLEGVNEGPIPNKNLTKHLGNEFISIETSSEQINLDVDTTADLSAFPDTNTSRQNTTNKTEHNNELLNDVSVGTQ